MAPLLPGGSSGTWALIGMAATLAGVTRSPLTAIVFAFELTHDAGSLLPLLAACAAAHLLSTTVLKRSILTEKIARRGFHVVREYQVEPLEALFVREAMTTELYTAAPDTPIAQLRIQLTSSSLVRRQRLCPVLGPEDDLVGVVVPSDLLQLDDARSKDQTVRAITRTDVVVAYPDETLRSAADRMAQHWLGALPVLARGPDRQLVGMITEFDLLKARHRQLVEERHRERVFRLRRAVSGTGASEVVGAQPGGSGEGCTGAGSEGDGAQGHRLEAAGKAAGPDPS